MSYIAVRNCKWANTEHTLLNCEVNFNHVTNEEFSPFTASQDDHYDYTKEIFTRAVAGEFGEVAEYTPPIITPSKIKI